MRRLVLLGSVVLLVAGGSIPVAGAQEQLAKVKPSSNVHGVSVSSHLTAAMDLAELGSSDAAIEAEIPLVTLVGGQVEVELRFDSLSAATIAAAEAAGLTVMQAHSDVGFLTGTIDPAGIDGLTGLLGLASIHPLYGATTNTGSVDNQADESMRADDARAQFSVDGSGIDIGILSDSFDSGGTGTVTGNGCNRRVSGTSSQVSGDLPTNVRVIDDLNGGGTDEGRGMAELIADLAPGSSLRFHTAFNGEADFAAGITDLVNCGSDVVVDDVIYFAEPMFQDGLVAQAAQAAVNDGVPFFSSAGNQAGTGIDDQYDDISGSTGTFGDDFHDFGGGDAYGRVTLDPGEGILAVMQWAEPFDGTLGPGASSDFDIYILDATNPGATILAGSASPQGCAMQGGNPGGDPLEIVEYINFTGSSQNVHVVVDRFCAGANGADHFRVATYGRGASITSIGFEGDIFNDMQQYGHAVAKDVASVAAVFYGEIDDPSTDPPSGETNVEPFSSLGGDIPIYFKGNGNPIPGAPQLRHKPEIAAADGTNTTFFGSDIPFDPDSDPNFFGTSAAAPHAAAVAALMLDLAPGLTPAAVYAAMENTAIDIESNGRDDLSGHGLVDAVNALGAVPTAKCNGQVPTIIGTNGPDVINGTAGKDVILARGGADTVNGKGGNDVICLGDGNDTATGGNGADKIFGQNGKDLIAGNAGNDTINGGNGTDTVDYSDAAAGVTVNLGAGTGTEGSDTLVSIENVDGSAFKDTINGDGGTNVLKGLGGNDTLDGKGGKDTLKGGGGKDTLKGGLGNDTLEGADGNDTLKGGGGKDTAKGGGGADVIEGGAGNDTLEGGNGNDTLRGEAGADILIGGGGTDTLFGGPGNDTCTGENESGCEA